MHRTQGILSCIGNTPLILLEKLFSDISFKLYAKLEGANPGGSTKDRPAIRMIEEAIQSGEINENTTIIESSSGNLGIGLAKVCAYLGLNFICVTDLRCTEINRKIMKAYGAKVEIITDPDPETGDLLAPRLRRIQYLLKTIPNSYNCDQYKNPQNPIAHYRTTEEILAALDSKVDYVFCATSTCGTLRGCSDYLKKKGLPTKVIAVDAKGSVIFGDKPRKRLVPGHGSAILPVHYSPGLEDRHILVSDLDCVIGCRKLIRKEGIFTGGSSGAIITAIDKIKYEIPPDAVCVAILPDNGSRYLDTIYSDEWVSQHFGETVTEQISSNNFLVDSNSIL
jgi:2,3-diaminopropionate biosynthesis protein SbnA